MVLDTIKTPQNRELALQTLIEDVLTMHNPYLQQVAMDYIDKTVTAPTIKAPILQPWLEHQTVMPEIKEKIRLQFNAETPSLRPDSTS
jgi:hypothetical protein